VLSPFTGRRGVCLPFSDACGPLLFQEEALETVRQQLSQLSRERRWAHCEIRGSNLTNNGAEHPPTFYGHTLRLGPDPDALFARFGDGTRRSVKQALTNRVTVDIRRDPAAMMDFYSLQVKTRRKHGIPPQPFRFFARVYEHMIAGGLGFTALAKSDGCAVAGAIFLQTPGRAVYKFAASDPRFSKVRGNNLVMWEAIRHLISSGCEQLDFGRTSPHQDGLRRFKLSWGAEEEVIHYSQFDVKLNRWSPVLRNDREGVANRVFRNMPGSINRLAGAMLYPHLD
jgi:hypothetical protein